jgi:hypothetical protein
MRTDRHHEANRQFPRFLQTRPKSAKRWMYLIWSTWAPPPPPGNDTKKEKVNVQVRTIVCINTETACFDTVWSRRWTTNQILQTNRTPTFTPVGTHIPNCKVSKRRTLIQTQQTKCRWKKYFCLARITESLVIKMRLAKEDSNTMKERLHQQERLIPIKKYFGSAEKETEIRPPTCIRRHG